MSHIYWELKEIPIPSDAHINHSDGRVFTISDEGSGKKIRRVIGRATSENTMHPNDMYKYIYRNQWEEYYGGKDLPQHELNVGMYATTLGIGYSTGLYPMLHETYGPLYANAIMDYAMYTILDRSDSTQLLPERLKKEVIFSKDIHSDSWYSELFNKKMDEKSNNQFRIKWLNKCVEKGLTKAWLSIDGSNNDCYVQNSDLCEKGVAKSHTNRNIISFIWVLDTETGTPITYFVNNGSMVDSKAIQRIITTLKNAGVEVEGIILDRGFCNHEVIKALEECKYPYIVMLKSDTYAHTNMISKYACDIRWNVEYCVSDDGIFGKSEYNQIFENYDEKAWINLYFDGLNGSGRAVKLIQRIRSIYRLINDSNCQKKPNIPSDLIKYFYLEEIDNIWKVKYNFEAWQKSIDSKGYCSIASSIELNPELVNQIYHLRDVSEKQFMIVKSQLGFNVTRTHTSDSILNKFAVCFIAAVIRSELYQVCKRLGYDTNRTIREIDRISLVLMTDGFYTAINNLTLRQKEFLKQFNIGADSFKKFAVDVNQRKSNPIISQVRVLPEAGVTARKRGRPAKAKPEAEADKPKKQRGRPKGSKNKKTLEKEAMLSNAPQQPKRKPGRPKGSKNKPKSDTLKRGPGRPKKSLL